MDHICSQLVQCCGWICCKGLCERIGRFLNRIYLAYVFLSGDGWCL